MLLAGLGWGGMPRHWVIDDLASGKLVELASTSWKSDRMLSISVAKRKGAELQPASDWLWQRLAGLDEPSTTP
ncbi:LysR substrate-binding domain-containing protein [Luteibacter sahnii]|uniref:LysR substrate-binding domain-containing protein n=1 Tax=Luteibacter sahnii TaxID=3021977 RepID=UPI0034E09223